MADMELHRMAHAVFVTDKQRRLDRAASAIKAYHANDGVDSSENCQLIDLFADLLHLARSMGVDGEDCYRIGRNHFLAEVREELECDADARLIAAAPELLATLREAKSDLIELYERAYPDEESDNDTTKVIDAVIKCIAKAEGRSEC